MASITHVQALFCTNSFRKSPPSLCSSKGGIAFLGTKLASQDTMQKANKRKHLKVVSTAGDVSSDAITYLFIGAGVVALLGTALPVLFTRKDLCPECDGAGFVRKSDSTLTANAARKDELQIVCARCNGLGKLNQIDK